jgi:hypothetical protein
MHAEYIPCEYCVPACISELYMPAASMNACMYTAWVHTTHLNLNLVMSKFISSC